MEMSEDDDNITITKVDSHFTEQDLCQDFKPTVIEDTVSSKDTTSAADKKEEANLKPGDTYRFDLLEQVETSNAGIGIFAKTFIPKGTLLILESPLFVLSETADPPDLAGLLPQLSASDQASLFALTYSSPKPPSSRRKKNNASQPSHDFENHTLWYDDYRKIYDGPEDGDGFEQFCTRSTLAWKIYETNRFTVRDSHTGARDKIGVFALASRLNHSCAPNVFHRHNHLINKLTIYSVKDIQKGEQVCTSYIDVLHPTRERRRRLKDHWGFVCACILCKSGNGAVEARRDKLGELVDKARKSRKKLKKGESWSQWDYAKALSVVEEILSLMDEEQMEETDTVGEVLGWAAEYAIAVGWLDMARNWAERALDIEERCLGKESIEWKNANDRLVTVMDKIGK